MVKREHLQMKDDKTENEAKKSYSLSDIIFAFIFLGSVIWSYIYTFRNYFDPSEDGIFMIIFLIFTAPAFALSDLF